MGTTNNSNAPLSSANEFVDVKDIKGMFLYTKSGYILSYIRMYLYNLDLLTTEERRSITNRLAAAFDGDRQDFVYCTLPRELDLDRYKGFLKDKRVQEVENLGKKHIIDEMIIRATELSSSNENFEHQHFFKLWKKVNISAGQMQAEAELKERAYRIRDIYRDAQVECEVLGEREIIKLCNLFSNNRSANYDIIGSVVQPEIPFIRQ